MSENALRTQLRIVAENLASLWNGARPIIDEVVEAAGDPWASPAAALAKLSDDDLDGLFPHRGGEVDEAVTRLQSYLDGETWFDRASRTNDELSPLRDGPIAYFCSEFGVAKWLPIYSGGLGILAGDVLKEASDMGFPLVGVGLLYRHGYFHQKLNEEHRQTEYYDTLDPTALGLERVANAHGERLLINIPLGDRTVYAAVWMVRVGRVPLYLLDTNVLENELEDDRDITGTLYGGDQDTRIRQEIVLGIGGVRTLHALGIQPAVTSMNEGHAAFLGIELLADEVTRTDFDTALARVRTHVVYTNHTVVPAGNDVFPRELVAKYLAEYVRSRGIDLDQLFSLAAPGADSGFQMALLAFQMSGRANAVSQLHAQVIPREWPGFNVEAVTNGVHVPTWTGPAVQELLDEFVPAWRGDHPDWSGVQRIPTDRLQGARTHQRREMAAYLTRIGADGHIDPDALTLVWARRFAEYKRAWLIGSDLARLKRILSDTERPVHLIFSGKSHPRDEGGKSMMQDLLRELDHDPTVSSRVTFAEDYSEEIGRYLTMGADIWLNTPRKPLEASGTSGMKSSDNGGLQVTVTDGWAAEVDWYGVGWGISGSGDHEDARELYDFLENSVIPTFYDRDSAGMADQWASMMRNTMEITLSRYSARRMMLEYVDRLYLPLLRDQEAAQAMTG